MKTVAAFTVLAVFLTLGACEGEDDDGLKCYVCSDCQPSFVDDLTDANTETCPNLPLFNERCIKQIGPDGVITRGCGTEEATCLLGEGVAKCDGDSVANCIICCDTDKCNSATTFQVSAIVLLAVAAMHKFMF